MGKGVFLIHQNGKLVEMQEQPYNSEDLLQRLLADYPQLLAGEQINAATPRRWLLITREASLPSEFGAGGRWSVDHLFLDQDATPTLVEVKRSSDTRIRREVVGQMLDYAANAVAYWPIETLLGHFESRCRANNLDPQQELTSFLGPDVDPAAFWQQAKTNLQAGKIRLVFIADEIPSELRRVVEFLNQQMDPAEVLAVEIKQYVGEGQRTLVSSLIGQTAEAQQRKAIGTQNARQWDESSFFEELEIKRSMSEVDAARVILHWAHVQTSRIWWGKGQRAGSFIPIFQHNGTDNQLFVVWTNGYVTVSAS